MAWRYHGRAQVDPDNPAAFAVCDRCGFWYNHRDLRWQHQWIGPQLHNLRILVCERCLDEPSEQLRTVILPPDPVPILNARPEFFAIDEIDFLVTQDGLNIATQSDQPFVTQPVTSVAPT